MPPTISLRNSKTSDLKYFLRWWKDKELIALTSGYQEKSDAKLKSYFDAMMASSRDHHYMIVVNSRTVGHIALTHRDADSFEIHIVIGNKRYWGKGLGTRAIKKALSIAFGKFKYHQAYLEVRPDNLRAIKAYEKCGFVRGRLKQYPNNKYQPVVLVMRLKG